MVVSELKCLNFFLELRKGKEKRGRRAKEPVNYNQSIKSSPLFERVFKAGATMLAAAKTGAATATTAGTVAKKTKSAAGVAPKPKRAPSTRQSGIFKATTVSPELGRFLGSSEASRTDTVKKIWAHIKLHNLQNPSNKREIICDEKLKVVFGKDRVSFSR